MEKRYRAEQVAVMLGISLQTLNLWYMWKRANPHSERAQLMPDFIQEHSRGTRYWTKNDVKKLRKFKATVKKGRNGIMGSITQKYTKRKDKTNDT